MRKATVGEWDGYEAWELREIIDVMENDIAGARMALDAKTNKRRKNATRKERYEQIERLLRDGQVRTSSQIARALGISPGSYIRSILCELFANHVIGGYAEGSVAGHYVYYWFDQRTLPLPFPDTAYAPPCQEVTEGGFLSSEKVAE